MYEENTKIGETIVKKAMESIESFTLDEYSLNEYLFINVIKKGKKYKVEYLINYTKYFDEVTEYLDNIAEIVDVNETNIIFFDKNKIEVNINSTFKEYLIINIIKKGNDIKIDFMMNYTNYRENSIVQTNINKIIEKDMEDDQEDQVDNTESQNTFRQYIQRSVSISSELFSIDNPMTDINPNGRPFLVEDVSMNNNSILKKWKNKQNEKMSIFQELS